MRVLLKKDAAWISSATILVWAKGDGFSCRAIETLAGEAYVGTAYVVDAADRVVADAVAVGAAGRGVGARRLFVEVWRMARILAPYALRAEVGQRWTPAGWVIDLSRATPRGHLHEPTQDEAAVAGALIAAEMQELAGEVRDEGLAATLRRVRRWRRRVGRAYRDAEEAHAILAGRPLPAWLADTHQGLWIGEGDPTPRR